MIAAEIYFDLTVIETAAVSEQLWGDRGMCRIGVKCPEQLDHRFSNIRTGEPESDFLRGGVTSEIAHFPDNSEKTQQTAGVVNMTVGDEYRFDPEKIKTFQIRAAGAVFAGIKPVQIAIIQFQDP